MLKITFYNIPHYLFILRFIQSKLSECFRKLKTMGLDKVTRAKSIQARMRAGGVKFDKGADWYQVLEDECMTFPRSKHDDQVDALAYMGRLLDQMIEAPTQEEAEEEEYLDELRNSDIEDGRSKTTGY